MLLAGFGCFGTLLEFRSKVVLAGTVDLGSLRKIRHACRLQAHQFRIGTASRKPLRSSQ
jgi:hypothetical protein